MNSIIKKIMLLVAGICLLSTSGVFGQEFKTAPVQHDGNKWRIGYYEGGEYIEYQQTLVATVQAFMDLGWIGRAEIPPQEGIQTKDLWTWLATQAKSEYLEFVADAHYTSNWNKEERQTVPAAIIERLTQQQDIDLMLAMGTWAGQDLANDKHHTPTVVLAVSDAVASKIVASVDDSGYDHVHARVDPTRYERQVQIFYDIIGFHKLGVAYKDTVASRSYAAIDTVEKVAAELGFEVVSCYITDSNDLAVEEASVKQCFQELGEKHVDAIYVTQQKSINAKTIGELVAIADSYRIPTFSQAGSQEVKYGFLLSIAQAGFKYVGQFYAETIAKILNGAKPRDIGQIFEDPPKIAINMKTAEMIGYIPPVDILGAADEIYQEIEVPNP